MAKKDDDLTFGDLSSYEKAQLYHDSGKLLSETLNVANPADLGYSEGAALGLSFASGAITGGTSGALIGSQIGAVAGPIGIGVGAAIGATIGGLGKLWGAKSARDRAEEARRRQLEEQAAQLLEAQKNATGKVRKALKKQYKQIMRMKNIGLATIGEKTARAAQSATSRLTKGRGATKGGRILVDSQDALEAIDARLDMEHRAFAGNLDALSALRSKTDSTYSDLKSKRGDTTKAFEKLKSDIEKYEDRYE